MEKVMDCFIRLYIPGCNIERPAIFLEKKYDYLDLNCVNTACETQHQAYEKCLYERGNTHTSTIIDCSEHFKEYYKCVKKEASTRH